VNYLVAHEAIHAHFGKISPYESCDFFEEGLADLISVFGCIRKFWEISLQMYICFPADFSLWLGMDSYVDGSRRRYPKSAIRA